MAARAHPFHAPVLKRPLRQWLEVTLATLLVAGCPVAVVWWLRASEVVHSTPLALGIGMGLSLLASAAGRLVWEKQPGSEDLLFNELMVWGYVHRLRKQRRLADTSGLIQSAGTSASSKVQEKLLGQLVAAMETRDPYLHGHSRRVARHAWMIAQRMKLPREEVARIRTAAALHDVGKTKTPKTILHKAGRLDEEEYRIIKLHPGEGTEMVGVLGDPRLAAMLRHHHERLDGSGYPDGLTGEAIPLGARIIAVADTFDAITSARPYRAASPHKKAIDILHEESGTRLDPNVVKAFCDNYSGRRPLALWSIVCGLPERMLSWLSSSVGAVASAAKVAVISAAVSGAAVAGATLGLPSSPSRHARAHAVRAVRLDAASSTSATAVPLVLPQPAGFSRAHAAQHLARHRRVSEQTVAVALTATSKLALASVPVVPVGGSTVAGPRPGTSGAGPGTHPLGEAQPVPGKNGEVPARTGEEITVKSERAGPQRKLELAPRKSEAHAPKKQEPISKKSEQPAAPKKEEPAAETGKEHAPKPKEEAPPKKREEAPAAKGEEHGKSSEAPGHVKQENAAPAPSQPAPVSAGSPKGPAQAKRSEAPGH